MAQRIPNGVCGLRKPRVTVFWICIVVLLILSLHTTYWFKTHVAFSKLRVADVDFQRTLPNNDKLAEKTYKVLAHGFINNLHKPYLATGPLSSNQCPGFYNCEIITQFSLHDQVDVIAVNAYQTNAKEIAILRKTTNRSDRQLRIFYVNEAPTLEHTGQKFWSLFNGLFHATVTYSRKSTYFLPLGRYSSLDSSSKPLYVNTTTKTRPVAWFVSHCPTRSQREKYVDELKKFISVDEYGRCGNMTCPREKQTKQDCYKLLMTTYYFYLAFENNICEDYMTEKVWLPLANGAVPIIMGGGNYTEQLPPKSFIDFRDFNSPRHLAKYLRTVIRTPSLYNQYHNWRKSYKLIGGRNKICVFCELANKYSGSHPDIIDRIDAFWNESDCKGSFQDI